MLGFYSSEQERIEENKKFEILRENYTLLKKGILPKSYTFRFLPAYEGDVFKGEYINWRDKYIKDFGFPLLSESWIRPLAHWIGDRPCLEVMAGKGVLSYYLRKNGVNIKATDNYTWKEQTWFKDNHIVENLDCVKSVYKYGKQVSFIICSWPYMDDNAYKTLLAMREVNPKCRMIYIGEWWGGCTASDEFFEIVKVEELKTFYDAVKNFSCWEGIHDDIHLLK